MTFVIETSVSFYKICINPTFQAWVVYLVFFHGKSIVKKIVHTEMDDFLLILNCECLSGHGYTLAYESALEAGDMKKKHHIYLLGTETRP